MPTLSVASGDALTPPPALPPPALQPVTTVARTMQNRPARPRMSLLFFSIGIVAFRRDLIFSATTMRPLFLKTGAYIWLTLLLAVRFAAQHLSRGTTGRLLRLGRQRVS